MNQILKTKFIWILLLVLFFTTSINAQNQYERSIEGVKSDWHKIILPDAIFGKIAPECTDIRVYGLNDAGEKVEQPFVLKQNIPSFNVEEFPFEIINKTSQRNTHYFTFKLDNTQTLNQIDLNFEEKNFDWKVGLEGSMDQKEWFEILNDYRILSIKNDVTDYQFTKLRFSSVNYSYFRLRVTHNKQPNLQKAKLSAITKTSGVEKKWMPMNMEQVPDRNKSRSVLNLDLSQKVPISVLRIKVDADYDYYRKFSIQYRVDNIKTTNGFNYKWRHLRRGVLSSFEENEFIFPQILSNKIRLLIQNDDNQMLPISEVTLAGYEHELQVRFDGNAPFTLAYGNKGLKRPKYDIENFKDKIPTDLTTVKIGQETLNGEATETEVKPLFANKAWLWGIMALVIFVLGGFTLKMMKG